MGCGNSSPIQAESADPPVAHKQNPTNDAHTEKDASSDHTAAAATTTATTAPTSAAPTPPSAAAAAASAAASAPIADKTSARSQVKTDAPTTAASAVTSTTTAASTAATSTVSAGTVALSAAVSNASTTTSPSANSDAATTTTTPTTTTTTATTATSDVSASAAPSSSKHIGTQPTSSVQLPKDGLIPPGQTIPTLSTMSTLLHTVPLLSKLNQSERDQLAQLFVEQSYGPNTAIIREGEIGHGFYIIARGDCVVTKKSANGADIQIATLHEADFFGETALINNSKRGATVTTTSNVTVLYLERTHFASLFGPERLNVQFAKRQAVSAERVNASGGAVAASPDAVFEKPPETVQLLLDTMSSNILFLNLDIDLESQIVGQMYRKEIKKGQNAIKQGDQGDHLYIVESGLFHVFVNGIKVATRERGTLFGELALMYNSPRAATVTAMQDSVVWVLDRFTFRRILTNNNEIKFDLYVSFLKKVELLTPLAEYERRKIAEALDETSFAPGTTIFQQGDEGEAMYIVFSGEVVIKKREQPESPWEELSRLKAGDYFGERALITNEARAASAVAVTAVQLLRLDRNAFHSLLGPLEDIMKKKLYTYQTGQASSRQPAADRPALQTIAFTNLQVLGTLGKGSFGYVQLVQDRTSGKAYALKAVNKQQIVKTGQQGHVMSEKRAMMLFDHPFCIKLYATYKDKDRLYFLLEPSLGGELFSVLRERTLFDEDTARFYAASVVLAFEYIHNLNFCYRDLKPENLLLDKDGYLKVTDFGFAKEISNGRTWTLCGTPDYLAPEIVAGKGHGKAVDWWTVGVFIYEMLASYPPFYDEDPMRTYAKIIRGVVSYPSHFSKNAISLISGFLQPKSTRRLGSLKGGVADIKTHPWFDGFDWDGLINRRLRAPIIPRIKSETDLSNFDDYSKGHTPNIMPYDDDGSNWDADF